MPLNSASSKPADVAVSTPGPTSPTRSLAPATASPISPFLPPPDSEGVNGYVSGGWKLALTSSKLLVFAIMAGLIATVAAEISGLLPFSILKLETIAYLLFGVSALCFLAWIVLVSAGGGKKKKVTPYTR